MSFAAVLQPAEITVALERSLLVPDGIFVGVTLSFAGEVAPETAAKDAADSLIKILGRFGIDAAG